MDRWHQYLFEAHSEGTLRDWAGRLSFFRFFRAYGGHANDGDSLDVAYRYDSIQQLRDFLAFLDLAPVEHPERPPQPAAGVAYLGDEYARFASLIPDTEWIEQPGHCEIAGHRAFIWCTGEQIRLSLASGYVVSESDVASAEALEIVLRTAPLARIEPPIDNRNCICPKYYPQFFGNVSAAWGSGVDALLELDLSTAQGALHTLEQAYRHKDLRLVLQCRNFRHEAELMALHMSWKGADEAFDEAALSQLAEVLEAQWKQAAPPDFTGVTSHVAAVEHYAGKFHIVTEQGHLADGTGYTQRIFMSEQHGRWAVLCPSSVYETKRPRAPWWKFWRRSLR